MSLDANWGKYMADIEVEWVYMTHESQGANPPPVKTTKEAFDEVWSKLEIPWKLAVASSYDPQAEALKEIQVHSAPVAAAPAVKTAPPVTTTPAFDASKGASS